MKKKGWLFVVPWSLDAIGGVNTVVKELCIKMKDEGTYQPYILVLDWNAGKPIFTEQVHYIEVRLRLPAAPIKLNKYFLSFLYHFIPAYKELKKLLTENNINVINPHYPTLSCIYFAYFVCYESSFKQTFITSFHGADLSNISNSGYIELSIWKFIISCSNHSITCSHGLQDRLTNVFPEFKNKVLTIHNGVSEFFTNTKISIKEFQLPDKYILSVGTFESKKGQDILIKAFKLCVKRIENYHLVLVGRTADELSNYRQLAKKLKIEKKVHFFMDIPPTKISEFYQNASIYVSSSRVEPFGLVMLEAAMFNIPVIATKTDGAKEILVHGEDGILVELEDTYELSKQLEALIKNKEKQKEFSDNFLYKAKHVFTWEKSLSKYISIVHK